MTILLNIKSSIFIHINIMYNHKMTKQLQRKQISMVFLILALVFLAIGLATDQTAFTWIAIAFELISLVTRGKWLRPRK